MIKNILASIICVILASGCAAPFNYAIPTPNLVDTGPVCVTIKPSILSPHEDTTKLFDTDLDQTLLEIFDSELAASGYFKETIRIASLSELDSTSPTGQTCEVFILHPTFSSIRWSVPDYEEKMMKAGVISGLTGGIGGLIYGSTKTDMESESVVSIKFTHQKVRAFASADLYRKGRRKNDATRHRLL